MSRHKKKSVDDKIEDLNLVPIMNLVVCLIPIVLVGMSLVKIGVINVNAPSFGIGQAEPSDDEEKPLGLRVIIEETGFRLVATGADINAELNVPIEAPTDADTPPTPGIFIPKNGEVYNYADLYNKVIQLKGNHPDETIINLSAEPKIHFEYIVKVMDAIRFELESKTYDDAKAFTEAIPALEAGQQKLLWPDVVLAMPQQ